MTKENIPEKLKKLEEKIESFRNTSSKQKQKSAEYSIAVGRGVRLAADLLAGVVVGSGIGFVLDWLLNTRPIMLVVFLLFGGAAGFLNIYRTAHSTEQHNELKDH